MSGDATPAGSFQSYLDAHDLDWLASAAAGLLDGEVPDDLGDARPIAFKRGMLRWALSDDGSAAIQWQALQIEAGAPAELRDRDRYVTALWRSLTTHPAHRDFRRWLAGWRAEDAYRRALFGWLVARFDLRAALRLVAQRPRLATPVLAALTALALPATVAVAFAGGVGVAAGVTAALVALALWLAAWAVAGLPAWSLPVAPVPRLAAGVGVGYLFLAAAPDLVRLLAGWGRPLSQQLAAGVAVLAALLLFAAAHCQRRVRPAPPWPTVVGRAALLLAFGAGHAAAGAALAAPVLFSPRLLAPPGGALLRPSLEDVFLCAVVALALGIVLQLAWEEKPLTDPL